jgi:hypothetical protein
LFIQNKLGILVIKKLVEQGGFAASIFADEGHDRVRLVRFMVRQIQFKVLENRVIFD